MNPTQKQLDLIADMQEFISEKFNGTTKQDASDYISRNIEEYKLASSDNWALIHGYF